MVHFSPGLCVTAKAALPATALVREHPGFPGGGRGECGTARCCGLHTLTDGSRGFRVVWSPFLTRPPGGGPLELQGHLPLASEKSYGAMRLAPKSGRLPSRLRSPPRSMGSASRTPEEKRAVADSMQQPFVRYYCSAYTQHCFRSLPFRSKRTVPSMRANSVSSMPMPTLVPGWMWVPL